MAPNVAPTRYVSLSALPPKYIAHHSTAHGTINSKHKFKNLSLGVRNNIHKVIPPSEWEKSETWSHDDSHPQTNPGAYREEPH